MPAGGLVTAGAIGLIGGGIKLVSGLFQKKSGNNLLRQNPYPVQQLAQEEMANKQIAENAATEGMPSAQYQQAQKNIQRQQVQAINAATDRRTGATAVGTVQQASNDAQGNLDAQSAAIRQRNVSQLLGVNSQVASYRDKLFDWNQKQKYLQDRAYGMSLIGAGNANEYGGIDQMFGAVGGLVSGGAFNGNRAPAASSSASQSVPLADVTDGPSPASQINYIDPNSYSKLI